MADHISIYVTASQPINPSFLHQITDDFETIEIAQTPVGFKVGWSRGWSITINVMSPKVLPGHINGLMVYAHRLGATTDQLERLQQTKQVFGLVIEPGFESHGFTRSIVLGIARQLEGVFFAAQSIYDQNNRMILGLPGMPPIFFPDFAPDTPLSLARKQRSIEILQRQHIPYIDHLPVIIDEENVKLRPTEEIALRAMALCLIAGLAMGWERNNFNNIVQQYGVQTTFSPYEMAFLRDQNPDEQHTINLVWRIEAYTALLWSLGLIDTLPPVDRPVDVPSVTAIMQGRSRNDFIAQAKRRPANQILDALDLHYRYAWALQENRLQHRPPPDGLEPGVIFERCHALLWVILDHDLDWDQVQVHT